jgi:hypothetical protein
VLKSLLAKPNFTKRFTGDYQAGGLQRSAAVGMQRRLTFSLTVAVPYIS